jgi:pentose-5-phosphate-3-epimerase
MNLLLETIISPSVLACDLSNLSRDVNKMLSSGANWLHMGIDF